MVLYSGLELKEFSTFFLTGAYQNLGSVLSNPCYEVVFSNESNVGAYISIDGTTNNFRVGAGKIFKIASYSRRNNWPVSEYLFKRGTQFQIKRTTTNGSGYMVLNLLTTI